MSEIQLPPHFTNIQHALQMGRQYLSQQDTPNRQVILITDGLPTAHFEGSKLFLLYPPDRRTESATMREGQLCQREGITINIFLLPSWTNREKTSNSPTAWRNRLKAACSSPPARIWTASWCGII